MNIKNKKGQSEVISYVIIIFIVAIIVSIIITQINPVISKSKSKQNFQTSKTQIELIEKTIKEVMLEPTSSSKSIRLDLENLFLNVDSDLNKIEIFHIMSGDYYENEIKIKEGNKFTYRENQKIFSGLEFEDINIVNKLFIQNKTLDLYFTKTSRNTLEITTDVIEDSKWYDEEYSYRTKLLIDANKVYGDLENFPVLIKINDSDILEKIKEDGSDLVFTLPDGETKLYREIEYIDTSDEILVWVNIPYIDDEFGTLIYMYFGNSLGDEENTTKTWNKDYVLVQHLNETSGTIYDSTKYDNDATNYSATSGATGQIGKAYFFNGSLSYLTIPSTTIEENGTVSLWMDISNATSTQYFLGGPGQGIRYNGTSFLVFNGGSEWVALNWNKTGYTWINLYIKRINANDYKIYVNGTEIGNSTAGNTGTDISLNLIGKRSDGYYFNGSLDEIKISNKSKSEEWIKTEYINQNDPLEFYGVGEIETN
ncbi:DUF2341 domain-containing protein [bacterium]|nr:DUF2341 domain-containing protein [bacterium]